MKKIRSFTLIEILVVLLIIAILATFVTISVTAVLKKTRDDRRISDVNSIASALDQYASEHKRKFPVLDGGGCNDSLPTTDYCAIESASLAPYLKQYISTMPQDPQKKSGSSEFRYVYVYRRDGTKIAVIADKFERGTGSCNVPSQSLQTEPLKQYIAGSTVPIKGPLLPCYYVSR